MLSHSVSSLDLLGRAICLQEGCFFFESPEERLSIRSKMKDWVLGLELGLGLGLEYCPLPCKAYIIATAIPFT